MIIALELCVTESINAEGETNDKNVVYIDKIANFFSEKAARDFKAARSEIILIHCGTGEIMECGGIEV